MAVDVAQCESSNIKCYASAFSNILIDNVIRHLNFKKMFKIFFDCANG